MKLLYDPETDSLYIDLTSAPGVDAREVADGRPVGIDIQHAAATLDLSTIETRALPVSTLKMG